MSLVLAVAAGYVLGRLAAHLASLAAKMTVVRWLERSAYWRAQVRRSIMRDERLKATLVGPWVTKER